MDTLVYRNWKIVARDLQLLVIAPDGHEYTQASTDIRSAMAFIRNRIAYHALTAKIDEAHGLSEADRDALHELALALATV